MKPFDWENYIDIRDDGEFVERMEKHTLTGRPLGTMEFVESLENKFGRRLKAIPIGRPKKKRN